MRPTNISSTISGAGKSMRTSGQVAAATLVIATLGGAAPLPTGPAAARQALTPMPAELETRFALSALPARLRANASVYLLDPRSGYRRDKSGTNGLSCLVQRTVWEMAEYRDDVYYALCYDAAGTDTYLKVIMDAARMRAEGVSAEALKASVVERYANGAYHAPAKAGLSYMGAPLMRTVGPPDMHIRTMAMPHLMFYAPGVTNADSGAAPDLAVPSSLMNPFIDRQGNDQESYIIQIVGDAEKARIMNDERQLVHDLCAHRASLCLEAMRH